MLAARVKGRVMRNPSVCHLSSSRLFKIFARWNIHRRTDTPSGVALQQSSIENKNYSCEIATKINDYRIALFALELTNTKSSNKSCTKLRVVDTILKLHSRPPSTVNNRCIIKRTLAVTHQPARNARLICCFTGSSLLAQRSGSSSS